MTNKLSNLQSGSLAKIESLVSCAEEKRLMALGFVQGTVVSVLKTGNPFVVNIDGMSVGISEKIANKIIIEAS